MLRAIGVNATLHWFLVVALACVSGQANAQIIRTYAGGGVGDGGQATSAFLKSANDVVRDPSGNLYIVDGASNRVRKVATNGTITTIAGNGTPGYSGDGFLATSAELAIPSSIAIDAAGTLYIADTYNQRIRKVATNGTITTVAGNGTFGYSGDGGPATTANLNYPSGVAVDSAGNLYIADESNHRIRKVATNGVITTVAGNGTNGYSGDGGPATSAKLYFPDRITVDAAGNLYISDQNNNRIRKVATNGTITTVAGNGTGGYSGDGGAATSAEINNPEGVGIDATGNLYIADRYNHRIRKVATNGTINTVAGNGTRGYSGDGVPATSTELYYPNGVAFDAAGNLYIADSGNGRIRKVAADGTITTVVGNSGGHYGYSSNGGTATNAVLQLPAGVATDTAGNVFIADSSDSVVRKVSANGSITTVAGDGLYGYIGDGGTATSTALANPQSIAIDVVGNLYIADADNNRIRKVTTNGTITTVAGNGTGDYSGDGVPATSTALYNPSGVAIDGAGNLYIADSYNYRIRKVAANGIISTVAGNGTYGFSGDGGPATSAELGSLEGIAIDVAGNLYVADIYNHRIRKVATNGTITTVAGNGTSGFSGDGGQATSAALQTPQGVAIDAAGNLYIADSGNASIRKVATNGTITRLAGDGYYGYDGDGGAATSATLGGTTGVAVDATGNLYIADTSNNRIRVVPSDEIFENGFQ